MKKKPVTAAELMAELNSSPEFVARQREQEVANQIRRGELARAEQLLVNDLSSAGEAITSVWDLVNRKTPYPKLIPILIKHLDFDYPMVVREGIARALAVPDSRPYWDDLVERYLSETDDSANGMKWMLHLPLAAAADLSVLDTLIQLASNPRHGRNRAMFVDALARINTARSNQVMIALEADPDLAGDVQRVLKKNGVDDLKRARVPPTGRWRLAHWTKGFKVVKTCGC